MIQELENKKIKYLHIMIVNSEKHNGSIIRMMEEAKKEFEADQHVFVITNKELYESLKKHKNVYFDNSIITNIHILKEYSKHCKYIFLHSLNIKYRFLLRIPKNIAKKIIWITWGHDLYRVTPVTFKQKIKEYIYKCTKLLVKKHKVKQFYAIGIGFKYDLIEARRLFGKKIRILPMIYGYEKGKREYINNLIEEENVIKKDEECRVMIGHNGYPFLNHLRIIDLLKKYKNENIKICLVLSYGNPEYAKKVKQYAIENFGQAKVEIISEMMPYKDYINYLKTIDICILDYKHQAALGNLWLLLYLEKKIYLNSRGILKLATNFEGAETYNVEQISQMNFKEFSKELSNPKSCKKSAEYYMDEQNILEMWKNAFREM